MADPVYCTIADLKAQPGIPDLIGDAEALALILNAEDLVDEELGARPIDPETGRKVARADALAWQWAKLARATAKLAAALYTDPKLATGGAWRRQKGPDFEVEDPIGTSSLGGPSIASLLNQTGLRRLATASSRRVDDYVVNRPEPETLEP